MRNSIRACLLLIFTSVICASPALAVYEKADGFPWNLTLAGDQDKPIVDELGGGFFMNVGPTGIRAQITHDHPKYFTVKFVFDNSPAAGKIKAGDIIIGGNGYVMDVEHKFGRRNVTGWDGPMVEMSKIIEHSQGKDGELDLIVWPGGDKRKQKVVTLKIGAIGKFSKTYPYNCERSDKLMAWLCDFLESEYKRKGGSFGRIHTAATSTLALMASGDNKYSSTIKQAISGYKSNRYKSNNVGGFPCWGFGYDGIVMGEYYILTKDRSIVPAANSLAVAWYESQNPENGGYTHRPYPVIANRVAEGGPKGYGPMAATTGLIMLGHSLFKAGGLEYSEECYQRIHQGFLHSWGDSGEIGYGLKSWDHAVIEPVEAKAWNKQGIGYRVPKGMEAVGQFKVTWPTKDDKRGASTDWLRDKGELEKAAVYLINKNSLLVVRDMSKPGPREPIRNYGQRIGHITRSGSAALAHGIGNRDNKPWMYMSDFYATACANSPNALLDGHASTLMHTLWGSLGAARAKPENFRSYMDGIKWWFIMAQTHDGGFVCMPGRDYASTDHVYATRNLPTATAALILSVKERTLQITGADAPYAPKIKKSDEKTTRARPTRPAPDLTPFDDGFTVEHCVKEARAFADDAPYLQVLRSLENHARRDDEKGAEAQQFAELLRAWLTDRNYQLIFRALTDPARTLAYSRDHVRRLTGLSEFGSEEARAMYNQLNSERGTLALSRLYAQLYEIEQAERERGNADATLRRRDDLAQQLDRLLGTSDLSESLREQAGRLQAEIERGPEPQPGGDSLDDAERDGPADTPEDGETGLIFE